VCTLPRLNFNLVQRWAVPEGPDMTMPSAKQYQGFLDALRKNVRVFDTAEHDEQRLAAALAIPQDVVLYLEGDEEVAEERLARPLGWLESAVNDSARGASPAALKPAKSASGRPTGLARERVQGTLAFAVELLVVGARVPADEASNFVARKSRKLVSSESGDDITGEQVAGWRRELSRGGGTLGGREVFRELRKQHGVLFKAPSVSNRGQCEALAVGAIKAISVVAPRSAPKRRGKRP
jgi:hypothetical protein